MYAVIAGSATWLTMAKKATETHNVVTAGGAVAPTQQLAQ